MTQVTVVVGSGSIGQAIAHRVSFGKHVVLADLRIENADAAAATLSNAGAATSTAVVSRIGHSRAFSCSARATTWRRLSVRR